MKKSTLIRKTPLKAYTSLKATVGLKSYKPLQAKTRLAASTKLKAHSYKPKYSYFSIFTNDLSKCYITGETSNVEIHHIFGSYNKTMSEKYGFLLPLRSDWHKTSSYSIHMDRAFNLRMKLACQDYYINVLKKSKEEWIKEFNKWWTAKDTNSKAC